MTDYHVHIGQFNKVYYYADRVFSALKACGTDGVWFSSTTSCMYFKECSALKDNPDLQFKAPSAKDLYDGINGEVTDALCAAKEIGIKAHALYWCVPEILRVLDSSISCIMDVSPYEGFKIHPFAQKWNLAEPYIASLAEDIFSYAEQRGGRILIHCGEDAVCSPRLFEEQIANHPGAVVQLAHSRPVDETLYMLKKYPNTFCDTAFAQKNVQEKIRDAGFSERILFGTDFPITHYRKINPIEDASEKELIAFLSNKENINYLWG